MRRALEFLAALLLALALVLVVLGRKLDARPWVLVEADSVALVSDFARGQRSVVATPGVRFYLPWFQEVQRISRAPGELRFGGSQGALPPLVVRASDGTTFSFESLVLRFALDVGQARRALDDLGPDTDDHARLRLNAQLQPHGLVLFEIPAALPRFDADYEQQMLRRRVAARP